MEFIYEPVKVVVGYWDSGGSVSEYLGDFMVYKQHNQYYFRKGQNNKWQTTILISSKKMLRALIRLNRATDVSMMYVVALNQKQPPYKLTNFTDSNQLHDYFEELVAYEEVLEESELDDLDVLTDFVWDILE